MGTAGRSCCLGRSIESPLQGTDHGAVLGDLVLEVADLGFGPLCAPRLPTDVLLQLRLVTLDERGPRENKNRREKRRHALLDALEQPALCAAIHPMPFPRRSARPPAITAVTT